MAFENKAIGMAYTSFMTNVGQNFLEVVGQQGSILVYGSPGDTEDTIVIQSEIDKKYQTKTVIDGSTLAEHPYPIAVFSQLVDDSSLPNPPEYGIDTAVELSWIIEQAYLNGGL